MLDTTLDYSLISNEDFAALNAAERRQIYVETANYSIDCAGHAWTKYKLVAENWGEQISDSALLAYKSVDYLIEDAEQAAAAAVLKQIDAQDK